MKIKLNFFLATLVLFTFYTCTTIDKSDELNTSIKFEPIEKPLKNVKIPVHTYGVKSNKDTSIFYANDTKIDIPANAFVDENGNSIDGEVKIKYQKVKTPGDIIASGITMQYEKDGEIYDFQTAGMFNISANYKGKKVYIKKGKQLSISYTKKIPEKYDLYLLDENKGWTHAPNDDPNNTLKTPKENGTIVQRTKQLDKLNAQIEKLNSLEKPYSYYKDNDFVLDIRFKYDNIEELKDYKGLMWKYAKIQKSKVADEILKEYWIKKKLEKTEANNVYKLKLYSVEGNDSILLSPILAGRNYKLALKKYNEQIGILGRLRAEKKRIENMARFENTVPITSLGWHNWDAIYKDPKRVWVKAKFNLVKEQGDNIPLNMISVYHVTEGGSVVKKYDARNFDKFSYNPNKKNVLIAILPDNNIATYSSQKFKKMILEPSTDSESFTFDLNANSKPLNNTANLDDVINGL